MPKKQTKRKTSAKSTENMKMEIANDFGVNLGAEATSRENGAVGGEMTRRLVQMGQERSNSCSNNLRSKSKNKSKSNK